MKINSPADDRIIVDLTGQDMQELDITYEAMDYSTIETRRFIWTVLDQAGKVLGRELDPSRRMIIEAVPKAGGGCVLNFTMLDGRRAGITQKQILKKQSESFICEFDSLDTLYRAAGGLSSLEAMPESSLYKSGEKFRLFVAKSGDVRFLKQYFSEFGSVEGCGKLSGAFAAEHWKTLIEQNALEELNR